LAGPGLVPDRRGGRLGSIGWGMHGEDVAASALEGDAAAEERRDRRDEGCRPAAVERPPLELGREEARLALQLRPASHDEPDDGAFERGGIRAPEPEPGNAARHEQRGEGLEAIRAGLALNEEHSGDPSRRERIGERPQLVGAGRDQRERPGRHDREVTRVEGVEGRNAGLQDPDPGDRTGLGGRGAGRTCGRQELGVELGELRHAGPAALGSAAFSSSGAGAGAPRARTRSSITAPSSRSKSSCRSARPTRSRRPSVRSRAQIRRRGK